MKKDNKRNLIIAWILVILFIVLFYILFRPSWFAIIFGFIVSGIIYLKRKKYTKYIPFLYISLLLVVLVDLVYIFFF
ncbi:hypothetical protein N489_09375 [Lactococcus lactis subsp. lactis 1AA59]|nr:hypothetical protein N489_09375 [Lactococcus lactis subsp. lactis 1AA59]